MTGQDMIGQDRKGQDRKRLDRTGPGEDMTRQFRPRERTMVGQRTAVRKEHTRHEAAGQDRGRTGDSE